jgi:hypothetical protein
MANFPINPFRFLPDGMIVDDGPTNRVIRAFMALPAEPPAYHGEYAIVVADREVADLERPALLNTLVNRMRYNHNIDVQNVRSSPFGIGLFRFGSVLVRDTMVEGHGFQVDEATRVTFVRHDEALNRRLAPIGQERWVLFLGFPLDFQTDAIIAQACISFALSLLWHDPSGNGSRVLVRVLLMDEALVPRSLILRQMGGGTGSWTVPVFLLRGFGAQAAAGFGPPVAIQVEEPIPPIGTDPHPFVAPNATSDQQGAVNIQQWWQNNEAAQDSEVLIP